MDNSGNNNTNMQFISPEAAVREANLKPGMVVADFGCGSGHITILMAQQVGGASKGEGKVYAVDVMEQPLEFVRSQATSEMLTNIETVRANLEVVGSTKIPDASVDLVMCSNVLFQSSEKQKILEEAKRVTKPGGRLVIIDWVPAKALFSGMGNFILSPEEAEKIAVSLGYTKERAFGGGTHHFGIVFKL
jgi:ubiquinone/menaquinone biosynthesis C-methylase UbiE